MFWNLRKNSCVLFIVAVQKDEESVGYGSGLAVSPESALSNILFG